MDRIPPYRSAGDMAANDPEAYELAMASLADFALPSRPVQAPVPLEGWQICWRKGFAPSLSMDGLLALRQGLFEDSCQLIQGANTNPLPLNSHADKEPLGACIICYALWKGDGLTRIAEIEDAFAVTCAAVDRRLGEPRGCARLLNFWDDQPRDFARHQLLVEVEIALTARSTELPLRLHVPDPDHDPRPAA